MADPNLIKMIVRAAKATGADPVALLATSMTENGGRLGLTPGDNGTSFGPFQMHRGGALADHSPQWASTYDAVLNRAGEFKRLGVHHGKGAAAVQRPADAAGYAKKVDANYAAAAAALKLPSGATAQTQVDPTAPVVAPKTSSEATGPTTPGVPAISVQGLMASAKQHLGVPTPKNPLLDMLSQPTAPVAQLKLPSGAPAQTAPPNPTTMDAKAPKTNSTIVAAAEKFMGTPYLWGGTTAKGLDCSGLVQLAVKNATGVTIPRVASAQYAASTKVDPAHMMPGDIIAFGTKDNVHHIGIYVGNGQFINAPHKGTKVRIDSLSGRSDIVGAGRFPSTK